MNPAGNNNKRDNYPSTDKSKATAAALARLFLLEVVATAYGGELEKLAPFRTAARAARRGWPQN
jgi:hypothetical protein